MWVNAQRDGRPAEYKWGPLFNTSTPQSLADASTAQCHAVTLSRRETR